MSIRRSAPTARKSLTLAVFALSLPLWEASAQVPDLPPGIVPKAEPTTFLEAVWKINATPEFFEALSGQPDPGPVINFNLLRYRPRGNPERYRLYGAVAGARIIGLGGDILVHGESIARTNRGFELSDEWDGVAYAMYPRRAAYLQLQRDSSYQAAIPDRVAGTHERMLYVLSDGDAIYDATGSIAQYHETCTRVPFEEGNVMISELLRFKDDGGRTAYEEFAEEFQQMLEDSGGEVVLSVQAEMPIVSEEYWDHFVAFRFPSRDGMERLYQSGSFAELNEKRIAGIDGSLAVLHTMDPARAKDCR